MRVVVDRDRCEGHAKCVREAAGVFEVREDDRSYVLMEDVPDARRAEVERAVWHCPRQAVAILE